VSCQFALHYSFESEQKARQLIANVANRLKPGGHFIGTIPDACWIVKKLRESEDLVFGNDVYKVEFTQKETFPEFGASYTFSLVDAVEGVPEYLVNISVLKQLANEKGLELIAVQNLHDFYKANIKTPSNVDLLRKMKVLNDQFRIPANNWEVAGFYIVFVFRKVGDHVVPRSNVGYEEETNLTYADIIRVKD